MNKSTNLSIHYCRYLDKLLSASKSAISIIVIFQGSDFCISHEG
jgi:hypothetical protein